MRNRYWFLMRLYISQKLSTEKPNAKNGEAYDQTKYGEQTINTKGKKLLGFAAVQRSEYIRS